MKLIGCDGNTLPHQAFGLVDSGCDYTSFPVDWMAPLGIDVADCETTTGSTAAGDADRYLYTDGVEVEVFDRKIKVAGYFCPGLPVILLGREDFFCHYEVLFDQRRKAFTITGYDATMDHDPVAKLAEEHKQAAKILTP